MMSLVSAALSRTFFPPDGFVPGSPSRSDKLQGSANSRSTSAGSSSQRSSTVLHQTETASVQENDSPSPAPATNKSRPKLPEYDYPVPLIVKNTFIDTELWRPSSLDGFLQERKIQSCPVSAVNMPPGLEDEVQAVMAAAQISRAIDMAALTMEQVEELEECESEEEEKENFNKTDAYPSFNLRAEAEPFVMPSPALGVEDYPAGEPAMLKLSEMLPEFELGSEMLPTLGSAAHRWGGCKPCAFAQTNQACRNGAECPFCHLCEPGEKKRRRKVWRAMCKANRGDY